MRKSIALLGGLMLAVAIPATAAADTFVPVKPGATASQTYVDMAACNGEARNGPRVGNAPPVTGGGLAGAIIGGLLLGAIQGSVQAGRDRDAASQCMEERGYEQLALTDAEAREFDALRDDDARRTWTEAWLARPEVEARVVAVATPVNSPLPQVAAAPFTVGSLEIDPQSLQLHPGAIRRGTVLTGRARYRAVARLQAAFDMGGSSHNRFPAGALMHGRLEKSGSESVWCGPLTTGSGAGAARNTRCFTRTIHGYRITSDSSGTGWLEGAGSPGGDFYPGAMVLEPAAAEASPWFDFEIRVAHAGRDTVGFEAVARHDGDDVTFWQAEIAYENGRAALPFWTHRLVMSRGIEVAAPSLTADGDGSGWDEAVTAPPGGPPA